MIKELWNLFYILCMDGGHIMQFAHMTKSEVIQIEWALYTMGVTPGLYMNGMISCQEVCSCLDPAHLSIFSYNAKGTAYKSGNCQTNFRLSTNATMSYAAASSWLFVLLLALNGEYANDQGSPRSCK